MILKNRIAGDSDFEKVALYVRVLAGFLLARRDSTMLCQHRNLQSRMEIALLQALCKCGRLGILI